MKVTAIYAGGLLLFIGAFLMLLIRSNSPEELLVGTWKEVSWEYEKVDKKADEELRKSSSLQEKIKEEVKQNLLIHEAETWEFKPDGTLVLYKKGSPPVHAQWMLKGRGHILKLKYEDDIVEFYDMYELSRNMMVLHFDVEIQLRGIAKLTFRKVSDK